MGARWMPDEWYASLAKPRWNPPSWLFAPVWTALYIMIAVAGWRVWREVGTWHPATALWLAQILANAAWTYLFFGLHRADLALIDIVLLWVLIFVCMLTFRRIDAIASRLFIPYLLWVSFATALNLRIWMLNR